MQACVGMGRVWFVSGVLFGILGLYTCDVPANVVRCYDCNYDPNQSEYVTEGDAESASWRSDRGFPRCSLRNVDDGQFVDQWPCKSGTCFMRKDPNGLVYRGCADSWNLPWDVHTSQSCSYQGDVPALWWFCEGNLCNGGKFGEGDVCSDVKEETAGEATEDDLQASLFSYGNSYGPEDLQYETQVYSNEESNLIDDEGSEDAEVVQVDGYYVEAADLEANDLFDFSMYNEAEVEYFPPYDYPYDYAEAVETYTYDPPAPVLDLYVGPPVLINQEFNEHYQSLLPREDNKITSGFQPPHTADSKHHESMKSWKPKSSDPKDAQESHKSWDGDNFQISGQTSFSESADGSDEKSGYSPEQTKSTNNGKKSHYTYTDHSKSIADKHDSRKSGYSEPVPLPKSVYGPPPPKTGYHIKSVKTVQEPHPKSPYVPPSKSEYVKSTQPPVKSDQVPPKSGYHSKSIKSVQEPPVKSSYVPPPKSGYHSTSVKSVQEPPTKSGYDGKSVKSVQEPPPKSGYVAPPKSGYHSKSVKSVQEPPAKSGYIPPPKSGYHSKSVKSVQEPPTKSGYVPPPKSGYHSKSVQELPAKSYNPPETKSHIAPPQNPVFLPPMKSNTPLDKALVPPAKSHEVPPPTHLNSADLYAGLLPPQLPPHAKGFEFPAEMLPESRYNGFPFYQNQEATFQHLNNYEDASNAGENVYYQYDHEVQDIPNQENYDDIAMVENPCSGDCIHSQNHFPHPNKDDWFIQCGSGLEDSGSCSCCKPNFLRCPQGTKFDISTGTCGIRSDTYFEHQ